MTTRCLDKMWRRETMCNVNEVEKILVYSRKERSWHVWGWVSKQDGVKKDIGGFGGCDQGNNSRVKKYSAG